MTGNVSEYLESTTIHGFSYLSLGRNICEKLVWTIIICTCFTLGALLIHQSIEEAQQNPVMTNVETISGSKIPFPAITVDSGGPDPWGYAQNLFDGLAFFGKNKGGEKLREVFSAELDEFFKELYQSYQNDPSYENEYSVKKEIEIYSFICLNHTDEKEIIDTKLVQLIKQARLDEQSFTSTLKKVTDIKVSYKDRKNLDKTNSAYPACEQWAKHLVNSIYHFLYGSTVYRIGFGTLLTYLGHLFKDGKPSDFLTERMKTNVSQELAQIGLTSNKLVLLLFGKGEAHENFNLIEEEKWCDGGKVKECHYDTTQWEEDPECCRIISLQALNMTSVFSVMKDSLQSPVYFNTQDEIEERQNKISQIPYDNILDSKTLKKKLVDVNPHARIFACNYANEMTDFDEMLNCTHFHRSITTKGFGISFNTLDFWNMYKELPFTKTFADIMTPKGFESSIDQDKGMDIEDQTLLYQNKNLIFPKNSGKSNEMFLILQAKWKPDLERSEPFHVSVHDPSFVPNMLHGSNEARTGAITTFTVWPQLIETAQDLSANTVEERSCQFNFEGSLKLFKQYHQDGCLFECLLEKSFGVANCTPWNYPYLQENQQTCNFEGAFYFEEQMKNTTLLQQCQEQCPQECTKILYTSSVSSEPFDIDGMCGEEYDYFEAWFFYVKNHPNGLVRNYEELINGKNMTRLEFCKTVLQRIAIVQIRLASNLVTAIKRSQRVTLTGQLANIGKVQISIQIFSFHLNCSILLGGTLGLFTGMSIMSFCEIIFWLCRFFHTTKKHCFRNEHPKRKGHKEAKIKF